MIRIGDIKGLDLTQFEKECTASIVARYEIGGPAADASNLDLFTESVVRDALKKAIDSGDLSTDGKHHASLILAKIEAALIPAIPTDAPPAVAERVRKPKREKVKSRSARWAEACANARVALDEVAQAKENFESYMNELDEMRQEFEDWHANLDGKLEGSPLVEKLEAVKDLTMEVEIDLTEAESALDEAEGADLPLGFGRD